MNTPTPDDESAILDRFLALAPNLGAIRPKADIVVSDLEEEADAGVPLEPAAAEALARALAQQGKRQEAAKILLQLALKMPEKSSYFADLLDNPALG